MKALLRKSRLAYLLLLLLLIFGYHPQYVSEEYLPKIYLIDSLLVRTEPLSGTRIYHVADPEHVFLVSEMHLEGNRDVAVRSGIMYADLNQNLAVVDLRNPAHPVVLDTIFNVFDRYDFMPVDDIALRDHHWGQCGCNNFTAADATTQSSGSGGSLARFVIVDDYLYCIDFSTLKSFDISTPDRPQFKSEIPVNWEIETLFSYQNYLFIGGQRGMYIYDISNPDVPVQVSQFVHARSCDPVVVENDTAYVTLRDGTSCGAAEDQLDIIDVKDIAQPQLLKVVPLQNPYGLAVRSRLVFVCDGRAGLKILDTTQLDAITEIGHIENIYPYDVILRDELLFVTAQTGLYIYDISDPATPRLLSMIAGSTAF